MEEEQKIRPRRPHFKTRTGCVQCKRRKIKCDEQKPICRKCEHHGTPCSYSQEIPFSALLSKTAVQSPFLPALMLDTSQSATFTMLDLELIYSWTNTSGPITFRDKRSTSSTLHLALVEIALQHSFLMHEILSLSALYLAQNKLDGAAHYTLASTAHHDLALSLFQPAIATLSRSNSDACFAFSILLIIHTYALETAALTRNISLSSQIPQESEPMHIKWVRMHRGNRAVYAAISPWLADGVFANFHPWQELIKISTPKPLSLLEQQRLNALGETWAHSSHSESVKGALDAALNELRSVSSLTHTSQSSMRHVAALSWISLVPEDFMRLVESRVPEAMLILASYATVLKRIDYMWWCKGTGEALLSVVMDILRGECEGKWEEHLRWPVEEVFGETLGTWKLRNQLAS